MISLVVVIATSVASSLDILQKHWIQLASPVELSLSTKTSSSPPIAVTGLGKLMVPLNFPTITAFPAASTAMDLPQASACRPPTVPAFTQLPCLSSFAQKTSCLFNPCAFAVLQSLTLIVSWYVPVIQIFPS